MKNIVLSTVAVLAMSSFAVAGGDIAPVEEPVVVVVEPLIDDSGFYLGLAYGLLNVDIESTSTDPYSTEPNVDENFDEIMLQAGYKFNSYIALEGRYWFGLDETFTDGGNGNFDVNVDAWGIYVKPMYPVTDAFDIYALLGYGNVEISNSYGDNWDDSGFQWGLGAAYSFNDNLSIFVDYVNLYDDTESYTEQGIDYKDDITISTWNFGVTYQF